MKGIGSEFMEKTKYKYLDETDQVKGLPQPELSDALSAGRVVIDLPAPSELTPKKVDLTQAMVSRISVRQYSKEPLTLSELAYLLWVTQGIKQVTSRPATLRTVPSAGSRHPFETYILVNKVHGLTPGLYHYLALDHKLEVVSTAPDLTDRVTEALYRQGMVRESAVTFLWVAVAYRTMWRYTERGYRYMHLDAGHVCQNLYLGVQAVECGCCGIAAFSDELVAQVLGIDGVERFGVYMAAVGKLNS